MAQTATRPTRARSWRAVPGLAAVTLACSTPAADPRDVPAGFEALVAATCDLRADCACGPGACEEREARAWTDRLAYAERNGLRLDDGCVEQLRALAARAFCDPSAFEEPPCARHCAPLHGDVQEGQRCTAFDELTSDCAAHLVCSGGRCAGPCLVLRRLREGESCAADGPAVAGGCAEGLECSPAAICEASASASCEPLPCRAAGTPCEGSIQCGEGLYCDSARGVCFLRPSVRESCPTLNAEEPCARPARCIDGTCRGLGNEGEACVPELGCALGLGCEGADERRCAPLAREGEPCDDVACREPLRCLRNAAGVRVCAGPLPIGAPCDDARTCASGWCPHGACAAAAPAGSSCDSDTPCERGLECTDERCVVQWKAPAPICSELAR